MKQLINFRGLSLAGDDHTAQPGELSLCAGVELRGGSLRPSVLSGSNLGKLTLSDGTIPELLFVHVTSSYTHYIAKSGNTVYWFNSDCTRDDGKCEIHDFGSGVEILSAHAVGNTLVIIASDGLHYALWQNGAYAYLGTHFPECSLSFGLQSRYVESSETFTVDFSAGGKEYFLGSEFTDEKASSVTEQVLARVNKFIAENYEENNEFMFPFFVRYAYRLYDGSLTMHSAPILMICASEQMPYVLGDNIKGKDEGMDGTWEQQDLNNCRICAALHKLDYCLINESVKTELERWGDIIKSVDVFISQPLYSYDASGKCTAIDQWSSIGGYCVCNATHADVHFSMRYQRHEMTAFFYYGRKSLPGYSVRLPMKSRKAIVENVKGCGEFFFLKSYKPSELTASRTIVEIDDNLLKTLVTHELMTDDYDSHDTIKPQMAYVYNSRLNVANLRKSLFCGYNPGAQFAFTDGLVLHARKPETGEATPATEPDYGNDTSQLVQDYVEIYVYIKQDGRDIIVRGDTFKFGYNTPIPFIFFPNVNAYKAVIHRYLALWVGDKYTEVPLESHPALNGAVYFAGMDDEKPGSASSSPNGSLVNKDIDILLPNKIYTSEVNNPYYFPVEGINTVGVGSIVGIAATTRALSQGQFGQYPLMAFCTDGIWALNVSSTGTYSSIHPISREVCVNPASICQLDQSVLFATDRALSRVVESTVASCSDALDGPMPDVSAMLPQLDGLFDISGQYADPDALAMLQFATPPLDYFKAGKILYDFTNSRVLILPSNLKTKAYVFSLTDQTWSTMLLPQLKAVVNAYPYPYIQQADGTLLTLDKPYDYTDQSQQYSGIVVTRPMSFSDTMQAVQSYAQYHTCLWPPLILIFGSNDIRHWHYIGRSRRGYISYLPANTFRYFRVALYLKMRTSEKYSSVMLDIIEKYRKL